MKIKMLNHETISKIAAGEVIIRPVSVIKELVENAIDAESGRITVAVEKGGKRSIRVTDDGIGIAYNEVPLAFKRHATSKLLTIDDLENIETLGFRGEALSSIAAVAKVRITTRAEGEEIGSQSFFENSALINQRVCPYDRGTEIAVTDLFYNTPARQKHLQKDKNEERLIRDMLEKLALSHPEIALTYWSDGKEVFRTPGTGILKDVIEGLYGRDFFKGLRPLDSENAPMRLTGYISDLTLTRATRDTQIFFINNRYVKNKGLSKAFEEAYAGYMMQHRHPVGIVFITLPGRMLDVNIHPAKTEIQILNESLVNILFRQGIREVLKAQNLTVDLNQLTKDHLAEEEVEGGETSDGMQVSVEAPVSFLEKRDGFSVVLESRMPYASDVEAFEKNGIKTVPLSEKSKAEQSGSDQKVAITAQKTQTEASIRESDSQEDSGLERRAGLQPEASEKMDPFLKSEDPQRDSSQGDHKDVSPAENVFSESTPVRKPDFDHVKIIGQLFSTYILLERGDEVLLLDQHAAHEAFLYEELRQRFERKLGFPAQHLMVPQTVEISIKEARVFEDMKDRLMTYGFDCDLFGETVLMVRSVPVILGEPQDVSLLQAFMDSLMYEDVRAPRDQIERIITMSCKKAVKGHQTLSHEEIRTLLDGLSRLENPYTCPHGRPIILKLREYELKKLFKRVV